MKRHSIKLADTRDLIVTDSNFGDAQPLDAVSKKNTIQIFKENKDSVLVLLASLVHTKPRNNYFR
jgi:hypothetical protein